MLSSGKCFQLGGSFFNLGTISILPTAIAVALYVRYVEKRSLASMGIVKNRAMRILLISIGAILALALIMLTIQLKGSVDSMRGLKKYMIQTNIGDIVMTVGTAIVTYGFFLVSLANRLKLKYAILIVCCLFPAFNILSMLLKVIFTPMFVSPSDVPYTLTRVSVAMLSAFFFSLLFLRTGHIWSVVGAMAGEKIVHRLISIFVSNDTGTVTTNLIMIVVFVAAIALVIYYPRRDRVELATE